MSDVSATPPNSAEPPIQKSVRPKTHIDLPLGEALTIAESYEIAAARRVQLVVVAGAFDSGKSSLIAGLLHCFQRGPLANYSFAGSRTLIGFDRRCHDTRTESGRQSKAMGRTAYKEEQILLHLTVCPVSDEKAPTELLIADVSGELYDDAAYSIENCSVLPLMRRADHFVLLLDGEKMSCLQERQSVRNDADALMKCCLQTHQIGSRSLVDIVVSKIDLLQNSGELAVKFADETIALLERRFKSKVGRLRFGKIAAIPDAGPLSLGYGIDELFPSWVEDRPDTILPRQSRSQFPKVCCEFDGFNCPSLIVG